MDYVGESNAAIDFFPGDFSGVQRCTNISILDDTIVEYNEAFNVILMENSGRLEIQSTRNSTRIIIMEDNDCKHIQIYQSAQCFPVPSSLNSLPSIIEFYQHNIPSVLIGGNVGQDLLVTNFIQSLQCLKAVMEKGIHGIA